MRSDPPTEPSLVVAAQVVEATLEPQRPIEQRSYEVLRRSLRELGHEDGAAWEQLTPRERAIWTARCRATLYLVAEATRELQRGAPPPTVQGV